MSASTRRQFLVSSVALTGAGAGFVGGGQGGASRAGDSDADRLDAGLERIHACYPRSNPHWSNHVPMVIEALSVLGNAEAIAPWMDEHFESVAPEAPPAGIEAERWRESLGRLDSFAAWRLLFQRELQEDDWRTVLRRWVPRLVRGLAGAATHGVIRSSHAVRALGVRDCAVRRAELATGLAYWAATHEELPWDGSLAPEKSVADALARIQPRRPALEPPAGNIVTGLRALRETPSFGAVAGWVDVRDPAHTLGEMAPVFARLYLRNGERRIAFTHSITAPSALRLLAPHLDEETVLAATRFAWQAAAGLYVVYGDPRAPEVAPAPVERAALAGACVRNGGAHSIKLTEACLREEALSRDPILLAAARDAGEEMNG